MRIKVRHSLTLVVTLAVTALLALSACQGDGPTPAVDSEATPSQPYAGLEERTIRALAPERVDDLLAGRGAGYALAAELNHYPGPTHVLELGAQLGLSSEQQELVSSIKAPMQEQAIQLGARLVDLEEVLDREFRSRAITSEKLASLTDEIASVEGELRNLHLQAHLQVIEVLSDDQVAQYDTLRGYVSSSDSMEGPAEGHQSHDIQH